MCAFLHRSVGHSCHQADLSVGHGYDQYNTFPDLLAELVAKVTQAVHVYALYLCRKELHAVYFTYLIHNVAQCILCQLALQGLVLTLQCLDLTLQSGDLLKNAGRSRLQKLCSLCELFFCFFIVSEYGITGQCLNSADTCCDTCLRYDLEGRDLRSICHMRTTTELLGEVAHAYDTHAVAIFFTEQCHCTGLLCLFKAHDLRLYRKCLCDLLIDNRLDLLNLFRRHRLEMCEVKPESVRGHERTLLLYMCAKHGLECLLEQMCRAVVLADILAVSLVHRQSHGIPIFDHALCHVSDMADLAAEQMDRILYDKPSTCTGDFTLVAILATHRCIERGLLYDHRTTHAFSQRLGQLRLRRQYRDL